LKYNMGKQALYRIFISTRKAIKVFPPIILNLKYNMGQQALYRIFISTRKEIKVFPPIILILLALFLELHLWTANSHQKIILTAQQEALCEPNDIVCQRCSVFRRKVSKMNICVRDVLDERLKADDLQFVTKAIPFSIRNCNLNWMIAQRAIQMIKERDTQIVIPPTNLRIPMTALVLGADKSFDMEQQLVENGTRVNFYGSNFDNAETAIHFSQKLNGKNLDNNLRVKVDGNGNTNIGKNTTLMPKQYFQKYFPHDPLDIVFLHLDNISYEFIEQLMGKGLLGIQYPVCQINVDVHMPSDLKGVRKIIRWFKELSIETKIFQQQYLIGYSTIVIENSEKRLRFYAINIGQTKCVEKFLNRSECRSLIGNVYDE